MQPIVRLNRAEEMFPYFFLVQQLQPWLKQHHFENHLKSMTQHNYSMLVLFENQAAVALTGIWIGHKLYCGKYLEMDNVVVDANHRNKGLGQQLYDAAFQIAKIENCRVMMLDAYITNEGAHRFYEKLAFEKKGYHFIKTLS